MSRPAKIWFREQTGWWCVTLNGKKIPLAKGRENRQIAQNKFHELMCLKTRSPAEPGAVLADLIDEFLTWSKANLAVDTHRVYRGYAQLLAEAIGRMLLTEIKPYHISRWIDGHEHWNEGTRYNAHRVASRIFSWAKEQGFLSENPMAGLRRQKPLPRERAMTREEFQSLMRASDGDFRTLLFAMWHTGARPKELRDLTWDQVRDDCCVLPKHKTVRKTKKPRVIYLNRHMQRLMRALRKKRKDESNPYVFLNSRNKPWTMNAVRLRIVRIREKLGLKDDLSAYLIRHAFGTNAVVNGVDIVTVAELMGHKSVEMISTVYCHLAEQRTHLQDAIDKATQTSSPKPSATSPD